TPRRRQVQRSVQGTGCGTWGIGIELKTLARHLMKKPAQTIGQVVDLSVAIVRHGDDILHVDL
ncbi:MAG TPA: hypothetical protein PLQ97_15310, partial [Myxococcota bacterium]|nr:hypothetical protein [Myxococcota bacterium]HQK52580.1 hypothetical protein [Myxococcota bacterium]